MVRSLRLPANLNFWLCGIYVHIHRRAATTFSKTESIQVLCFPALFTFILNLYLILQIYTSQLNASPNVEEMSVVTGTTPMKRSSRLRSRRNSSLGKSPSNVLCEQTSNLNFSSNKKKLKKKEQVT